MATGIRRAVKVWHRRSGKDKTDLNFVISKMFPENKGRIGTYFHLFPTYAQGKKIIWDSYDAEGFKVTDHFPRQIVAAKNESELQITLTNGSIYQVIGTDKMDSIVGTNPVGCVFSEYALQNPRAWDLIRPILLENDGWALFNLTPRGNNHGKKLYEMAQNNRDWYCSLLTVADTFRADGRRVITDEMINSERREGMADELIQQEYYCSFEGYQEGSYYTKQLLAAEKEGRIADIPWLPNVPVFTWWDLGVGDSTAIWFVQRIGMRINLIDYEEHSGEAIAFYAKLLQSKPYVYARHYWPHDGRNRDFGGTGQTRRETGEDLGIDPIDIVARGDVDDGIEATRQLLTRCWFDRKKTEKGRDALASYHKEWDEDRREFKQKPEHDWSSHGADGFRTGAMSDFETVPLGPVSALHVQARFNPTMASRDHAIEVQSRFHVR